MSHMDVQGGKSRLDFMGVVTASATHEIKNELAVINEQSHLMQEMLGMAREGREPDPARLENLVGRIVTRVGQADQAVRRLNAFAHSAEADRTTCDPAAALELMARMFVRPAGLRNVELVLAPLSGGRELLAPPLWWEELIWAALDAVCKASPGAGKVMINMEISQGRLRLILSGSLERTPDPLPEGLLERLSAECEADMTGLRLDLPLGRAE